ncbi:DUF2203 domain-containing protein [Stigmatella aurantiaca]|uniref:Conserved uncharacterized protein n=1 Tax=Stigmatella aurantiaca (strain DW4/3-1) TaxID=378806 RepID=Q096R3_STIAD|nr:conserved uncharacterized protein [Stigmatella aurantiaca DW4/3-1]EAU67706.1 conserved hypothetical protein [Stigmatella aurantiaca DW4/3-1]
MASQGRANACCVGMRYFGVDEANRMVPLLNRTFERVRPWVTRAQEISKELEALRSQGKRDAFTETLQEQHTALLERIRAELHPLQEMGIEVKAADGLVDFHALLSERTVYLCWRYGETSVDHWHELETGFAGRQRIEDPDAFAPTYLS